MTEDSTFGKFTSNCFLGFLLKPLIISQKEVKCYNIHIHSKKILESKYLTLPIFALLTKLEKYSPQSFALFLAILMKNIAQKTSTKKSFSVRMKGFNWTNLSLLLMLMVISPS